ncbi:putative nitrate/sulfonate/bicarbonate ABC transporter permease protein [Thermoclostridium stercorarium subsp. stercorarium DSM 8532]|jgi:NitT/TauT family transport system permease protein|uniref:ABC transporter permease n=3 Tax=Thermoclostridium stercorarium TaxID=1510 RepID=A0A1B1YM70_THEST|nr:ABC transporter permease [Thermoclostridium stercorarium]AGC68959.1 putative nitrate/sulfonate/bicarbonate ABC transporter permease protein [Thermoclostridium stercorarium subsp. stercorarium DSM 8532]AGI39940.1 ABC transporter permease subunit [Thermoclostridium stercorarium subsp. stercorarium DSM 8532]ANW99261.1 ABC transporter permease [Thermoclostridium stercorarium subsp. thermolacticum DSM 2910]ANX01889.1 ABC transporter permease [Thermoclostridium stercorarium subsp. leptospartum DSM
MRDLTEFIPAAPISEAVKPAEERQLRQKTKIISPARWWLSFSITLAGFAAAIAVNLFVRQIADVEIKTYTVAGFNLTFNTLYRLVIGAVILLYAAVGIYSYFDPDRKAKFASRAPFRFVMGIVLAVWDILGTKLLLLPQPFFPGPAKILEPFLIEPDFILENTLYSLKLYFAGFSLGVILGVGTGILIGWFPKVYYWLYPVLKMTGVIPSVAWMPFALTLFPTPFMAAVFLIVICGWFSIASLTAQGIQSTPKALFEVARTLGAKTPYLVFHVAIPQAMPQIFTGISNANGFAFTTLVMAEMMGQPGGLGYYINLSKVWSAYYKVFAAILVMAVLFSLIMKIIGVIRSRVLRWQKGWVKE